MNKKESQRARVKALVFQDPDINETALKEFHMDLEKSLFTWERRGRTVRRIAWLAVSVLVADILAILVIEASPALRGSDFVRSVWATIGGVSLLVSAICLVWYRDRYRPTFNRAKFDLQTLMIRELQQQVAKLRQEVNSIRGS